MNLLQDKYQDLLDIGREWKLIVGRKTADECVKIAENLAKEHGGVLPSQAWLHGHDHSNLADMIQRHPERFVHIKQEKLHKTIEEWIIEAENLAKEHGGVLPNQKWLTANGHGRLSTMIQRHTKLFAHIKQKKFSKTVEEHIADAEKLIKEYDRVLPSHKWLHEHGHSNLVNMIQKHPERFVHIKQEKLLKTIEEYIDDAENLAREHDGVLPRYRWLIGNGYNGLANTIYKYPERFAHIRRMFWNKVL
jgi:hypothetical protein